MGEDKNGVNYLTDQPCNGDPTHDTCPADSFTGETGLRCYNQCCKNSTAHSLPLLHLTGEGMTKLSIIL